MCGLAAVLQVSGVQVFLPGLDRMQRAIAHRGPDASDVWVSPDAALVHQRLSIVDLSSPPQPRHNDRYSLIYNGEIYNHNELRAELSKEGVTVERACDTDVVLAACSTWGCAAFAKFNGMFALVLWDRQAKTMVVARDRFGIKPLYVGHSAQGHRLFASELSAIEAYDDKRLALDPLALDQYLSLGYVIEPFTIRQGVRQVEPGTFEVHAVGMEHFSTTSYWSLANALNAAPLPISSEEGIELLRQSVRRQLTTEVPIGTFLSGGLDSGLLTALLREQLPDYPLHCFSAGFSESDYDELPEARRLAMRVGAIHHESLFDDSLLHDAGLVPQIYSGPFADNAALPTYHLSVEASKYVKVLLSGDGADELFFGYRNHRSLFMETKMKSCFPSWVREYLFGWLADCYPNHPGMPRVLRAQSTLRALSMTLAQGYCSAMSLSSRPLLNKLYSHSFRASIGGGESEQQFSRIASEFEHEDPMKVMQYLDFKTYLPGSVLTKVDRASMRAGVEARVPFLDNDFVTHVLPQDSHLNLGWSRHKMQLRRWSTSILDEPSRNRVKKSFTSPLDTWLRTLQYPKFCRMIMSESLLDSGVFNPSAVQSMMDDHYEKRANHGTTLLSLCVLSKTMQG